MPLNQSDQQREEIHYESIQPNKRIHEYVDRILYGYAPPNLGHQITIPPSGGVFLSYVIGSPLTVKFQNRVYDAKPRLFIGGQLKTEAPVLIPEKEFGLLGFQLTPTGFYKLFGLNTSKFTDDIRDLAEVVPDATVDLIHQIGDDPSKEKVIDAITNYIDKKQKPEVNCDIIDSIVDLIRREQGNIRIRDIVSLYEVSSSKLRREFLKKVGVAPKYFAKIVQFNTVSEALATGQEEKLNQIALSCGYFDQAHFIKDFQKYLGMNPLKFVKSSDSFLRTFLGRVRE